MMRLLLLLANLLALTSSFRSLPAVFSQVKAHRSSLYAITTSFPLIETEVKLPVNSPMQVKDVSSVVIFVVDCSMPLSSTRIDAVKAVALDIIPKSKASVISCYDHGAELTMEITSSSTLARRRLLNMKKSSRGNLFLGMEIAVKMATEAFAGGMTDVTIAVVADGKARGLLATSLDSNNLPKFSHSSISQQQFRTVVVDTENVISLNPFLGSDFANAFNAEYFRTPNLTPVQLSKIVSSKSSTCDEDECYL
jgi:Mg-chelatase subunit ChlD